MLIRPVIDINNFADSAMNLLAWQMQEKMWLLASLEALSANSLNFRPRRILLYYEQVAEQHYGKKLADLIGEQALALINEEEVGGPSCVRCGTPMGEDPQECTSGGGCVWEEGE